MIVLRFFVGRGSGVGGCRRRGSRWSFCWLLGHLGGSEARGQCFDQQIDDFPGGGAIGVLVGIELSDVEAQQILVCREFLQLIADLGVVETAAGRNVHGS